MIRIGGPSPVRAGLVRLPSKEPARITFVCDLFGHGEEERTDRTIRALLKTLTAVDILYLMGHPDTPGIYEAGVVYQEEPPGAEDWQDIPTTLRLGWGDCLPISTVVLRDDGRFVPLGSLRPGARIMGDGNWTNVLEAAVTGRKAILAFDLDNGCTLRCSPEHRVFLRNGEEVRASDVKIGDALKSPSSIACAGEDWTPDPRVPADDMAWLAGVYAADGWGEEYRFAISGDDHNPKRGKLAQKERVAAIATTAGISCRHATKYVAVNDRGLAQAVGATTGATAPEKRLPTLLLSENQVRAALEGLATDASVAASGTLTHGTTSPELALQTRVLYRMLGQSVHIRRWDDHGGLGSHPMYRVTVRRPAEEDAPSHWKTRAKNLAECATVRAIRDDGEDLCADITTDTGRFYLPESDLVVHNCEDLACWRAAELQIQGVDANPIFTRQKLLDGSTLYHIQVRLPDGTIEDPSRKLGMR